MNSAPPSPGPRLPAAELPRTLAMIAWGGAACVALLVPCVFLAVGYQSEATGLEVSVQFGAEFAAEASRPHASSKASTARPDEMLASLAQLSGPAAIRIADAAGNTLVQSDWAPDSPVMTRTAAIRRSGMEPWQLEMSRSMRPLLLQTALMIVPGLLLGWISFNGLKIPPMRALRFALQEIAMRKQTEERLETSLSLFAATLESTTDGIFAADSTGRTIVSNERFLEMWNIPKSQKFGGAEAEALATLASQLVDPTAFFNKQRELTGAIDLDHTEVLELRDGRIFEWNSRPQRINGKAVGRVSSFRDISERSRSVALLSAEKEVLERVVGGVPLSEALAVLARHVEVQARQMFCAIVFRESGDSATLHFAMGPSLSHTRDVSYRSREVMAPVFEHADRQSIPAGMPWEIAEEQVWGPYREMMGAVGVQARFAVPIRSAGGYLLGLVVAHYRSSADQQPHDLEVLRVAANLTGIAIERRQAEARLDIMAHYDALTGLPNRVLFRDRLEHGLARAERNRELVAVLYLDLDRFKTINDTLGHDAGDLLLQEVAKRLLQCVRGEDTIARLGGDEFTMICEGIGKVEDAATVAGKILHALSPGIMLPGQEAFVTPSIGITVYPFDGGTPEILLKNADTAMYQAKQGGGNSFQFFTAGMNTSTIERLQKESALRHALERNEFVVHYQPKVDLASGLIIGAEALLRWQHPQWGLVPPGDFIPILEETGLIEPVGEWVMRTVCTQNQEWLATTMPPLSIAVNLSGRQLQRNNLAARVAEMLQESGMNPIYLELEVTESMLMHDPDYAADMLAQIRTKGIVSIDIDDFGTGYSSLSYLKRFPIDALKIDKSFVDGLPQDEEDAAITRAVIALAHSLRLKVIAEGVETEAQLGFLREAGCDVIQGYIVSRPLPAVEFAQLVRDHRPLLPAPVAVASGA